MKEEWSEMFNGEKAICRARRSSQVPLESAAEEQDNFASEMVELTKKENEKLQKQIAD